MSFEARIFKINEGSGIHWFEINGTITIDVRNRIAYLCHKWETKCEPTLPALSQTPGTYDPKVLAAAYNKTLFDFINKYGEYYGNEFVILDNTGPKAEEGEKYYRVLTKGGIHFKLSREQDDGEWHYFFLSVWDGPFESVNAQQVLYLLTALEHCPYS